MALLAVGGCSLNRAEQAKTGLNAFVGQQMSDLAGRFGPPDSNYEIIDTGYTAFQWDHFGQAQSSLSACRVVVTALPTPRDAPPNDLTKWSIVSVQSYGRCG